MNVKHNIYWHDSHVTRDDRERMNGHRSALLWFTGLSGAGKSTVAQAVDHKLYQAGYRSYVLDGDNIRHHLCADLGFTEEDRSENIRRIGEVSRLFLDNGTLCLTAFISPLRNDRDRVRDMLPDGEFIEIFCNTSLEECERRDVKGLYKRARAGEIPHFTGISSPYEAPENAELVLDTGNDSIEACAEQVIQYLEQQGLLRADPRSAAA